MPHPELPSSLAQEPIAFNRGAGADPLWRDVPLEYRTVLSVFGVPVLVESNAAAVPALLREAFPETDADTAADATQHANPDAMSQAEPPPLVLRVVVEPARGNATDAAEQWRMPDAEHTLVRVGGALSGWIDLAAGRAVYYVEEPLLRAARHAAPDATPFDGALYTLVTRRDRHPVHASGLRAGDAALLLVGRSGAGKSTLCYAASRMGARVFSDDSVRVQLEPDLRVWGGVGAGRRPGRVHLLDDVVRRYPELHGGGASAAVHRGAAGTLKYAIPVPMQPEPERPYVTRVRVCLLSAQCGEVACAPASAEEIVEQIVGAPEASFDLHPQGRRAAAEAVSRRGGWKLTLSEDPEAAMPAIWEMLAHI